MVLFCNDKVLVDVSVIGWCNAFNMVCDCDGCFACEHMAHVEVCHVSRMTLWSFAFEIFGMFWQTGWKANS